ncbi:MAG: VanZ family protein [Anaerolineae bacterium]|nr:VanZ family protein [Anaerolineae bacterium]
MRKSPPAIAWVVAALTFIVLSYIVLGHGGSPDVMDTFRTIPLLNLFQDVVCILQRCDAIRVAVLDLLIDGLGNIVVFVPFGAALTWALMDKRRPARTATIVGAALSLTYELLQLFIPGRVVASGDVVLNTIGAAAGAYLVEIYYIFPNSLQRHSPPSDYSTVQGKETTTEPLKILMALQYYVPHRTGLTLYIQRLAEALAKRGHQVTVLTARYNLDLPRDEQVINGVRVIRLWAPIRVSRGMVMPAYPWAAFRLVQMHDVVQLSVPTLETFIFAIYTKLLHKGFVITHHGDLILPERIFNRFVQWFTFMLYRSSGTTAQSLVAYSQDYANQSYYIEPFRNKTTIIYPPIFIPEPDQDRVKALRKEWLGDAGEQARLIGYSGRFVEEKRPDVLIRALPTIHEKYPGTKIVFAGQYDIKYEDFYERNADLIAEYRDHLIFLGLIEDSEEVANFYTACDVLALPSDTECFALVQVEAMRCGTPVVSTDIPGARVVVRETGMGEIVPPRNPESMGEAICRIFDKPEKYIKTVEEIDAVFGFEKTVDAYERLFAEAAKRARKSE